MEQARRVCLFTGIAGNLGHAFAAGYADDYDLVGVYNVSPPPAGMTPLGHARSAGGFYGVQYDLGEDGAIDGLVETVADRFGTVDLLVNAAAYRQFGPALEAEYARSLEWQFAVNVCIPVELASCVARRCWSPAGAENNRQRNCNVVNLSSTAGHRFHPGFGLSGYSASKAAVDAITRHLAFELAPIGVRANAVAPDSFPDVVASETVADAVVRFDRSDQTGAILVVDREGERLLDPG